ncbi:hypothetical protein BOTBODRAFT_59803 [Botryobasidium botryosum FD-172 SS1]|uniref:Phosphoribosylaminoimidazole carboxylase n=1 Tax=Botryobasidium botryosum (strain FD-172 SS1) TaxID=930990 RepID=A0A067LX49_BOTB1|nr:hypothetical protein BOTBODRAFT_59803 [Botryobasidium botryosum FD-172 SS1]
MDKTVGVLGGGQLGRMLAASASLLNVKMVILDVGDHAPAKQIISPLPPLAHIEGSFADPEKVWELAAKVDVLTVEIEHVNVDVLEQIEKKTQIAIHPSPQTLRVIQDKLLQKEHLAAHGVPTPRFTQVASSQQAIVDAASLLGLPLMLKSRTLAYDGRGNFTLRSLDQASEALSFLEGRPLYAEQWAPFVKEIAVMVVRDVQGSVRSYPAVETVHENHICHLVLAPLRTADPKVGQRAQHVAEEAVKTLSGAGVFGVEMFLMPDDSILINEIAPRPHNSGHYTIEACLTSQYENHLRAILSLPLGSTSMHLPSAAMLNLIGTSSEMQEITRASHGALSIPGANVHLYGKAECRKGRKMGHVTIIGESDAQVRERLRALLQYVPSSSPDTHAPPLPEKGHSHTFPLVGIIMGSDSDLPVMLPAARTLDHFAIPYELTIVSAHRTPDRLVSYSKSAASRGIRVIIAGAGGAAHLPGMVAALTVLPVIGVPVKGSVLDGVDSLHSIVQMPRGIPVATVAINNGTNAGLLAARIIGTSIPELREQMAEYLSNLEKEVMVKVHNLEVVGWEEYMVKK